MISLMSHIQTAPIGHLGQKYWSKCKLMIAVTHPSHDNDKEFQQILANIGDSVACFKTIGYLRCHARSPSVEQGLDFML